MENNAHLNSHSDNHSMSWYDKNYRKLLVVPALVLLISLAYLTYFYNVNGDIIYKGVSLTGGVTITVFNSDTNIDVLKENLKVQFPEIGIRSISDIRTGKQIGFFVESNHETEELKGALEKNLGYALDNQNSSTELSGAALSSSFYSQLRNAVLSAFLLMGWVIFFIFSSSKTEKGYATVLTFLGVKILLSGIQVITAISLVGIIFGGVLILLSKDKRKTMFLSVMLISLIVFFVYSAMWISVPIWILLIILYMGYSVPSFAVILAAFADIVMTLAVADFMGMQLSAAGIVAFLMLIGYSVDTDILLTTRLLKNNEGSVNQKIFGAFKTGMTMTLTAIAAIGVSLAVIYSFSDVLRQIFSIILIGLSFDIINTWITNASILKWYVEVNNK